MINPITRVISALLFISCVLHAQDESDAIRPFQNEFGPGARAMALGGAYSAVAEDYTAVYWNPAGLAQIRKMEFYGSLSHLSINNRIGYQGTTTENTNGFTNMNAIGMVFPIPTYRGSLVFAFGYNRISAFDDFNRLSGSPALSRNGKAFQQQESITTEGGLNQWSFAGALDLTKNVSVGATLNLITGKYQNNFAYFADDSQQDADPLIFSNNSTFQLLEDEAAIKINQDFTGVGFKIGSLMRPTDNFRLALTITAPSSVSTEESSSFTEIVTDDSLYQYDIGDDPAESFRKFRMTSPWRFEIGAAYKYRIFTFSTGIEFVDWSETRLHSSDFDEGDINFALLSNYRSVVNYRFGAEAAIPALGAKAMVGYQFLPSPLKPALQAVKSDRTYLSGGLSFLLDKQVKIDFAYQRGSWKQSLTDNFLTIYESATNGDYATRETIKANKLLVSLSYRF